MSEKSLSLNYHQFKPKKGELLGPCNRKACQKPGANWFNHATQAYYCRACAMEINLVNPEGPSMYGHPICTPYRPTQELYKLGAALPKPDHAPVTAAEFVRAEDYAGLQALLAHLLQDVQLQKLESELAGIIDLPFANTYDVLPEWTYNAAGHRQHPGEPVAVFFNIDYSTGRWKRELRRVLAIYRPFMHKLTPTI